MYNFLQAANQPIRNKIMDQPDLKEKWTGNFIY